MVILPIAGTWGWKGDLADHRSEWWHPKSPFMAFLGHHDVAHICPEDPFIWSTRVAGTLFWSKNHTDWMAGGAALSYYLGPTHYGPPETTYEQRNIIAHSHAGQVVAYACAFRGLRVNKLITVGTPVREDMLAIYRAARPNIGNWLHIASPGWSDRMQWLGEMFDGSLGVKRSQPFADMNHLAKGIGHSKVLRDPSYFTCWITHGWLDWLKSP